MNNDFQRQQGQGNKNYRNYQNQNSFNNDVGYQGNYENRQYSPKKKFQKPQQNFQQNNQQDDNSNYGGGAYNRQNQYKNQNQRQQQGQRSFEQKNNNDQFNQQNKSKSPNQRQFQKTNPSDGDWQQQRQQQNNQNFQNNRNPNYQKDRRQPNNFQRRDNNKINNANQKTGQQNKYQFQNKQGQNQNYGYGKYAIPPLPASRKGNNEQDLNDQNQPVRELVVKRNTKKQLVNNEMKGFINDKDESEYSNSQDQDEQQDEDDYDDEQEENEDTQEVQYDEDEDNQDEDEDNEEDEQDNDDNDDQRSDDISNEGGSQISNEDDSQSDMDDQSDKRSYNDNIKPKSNAPVRELQIKKVGQQQQQQIKDIGVDDKFVSSSNYLDASNFNINNIEGNTIELMEQKKKLDQMCHETIDDKSWLYHLQHMKSDFAFFERNKKGEPQKHLAMKVHYRSAAAKELNLNNILSPVGIKKSIDRIINEILDYFLSPTVNVQELVFNFTNRLRTLTTELEPLSEHLSLCKNSLYIYQILFYLNNKKTNSFIQYQIQKIK